MPRLELWRSIIGNKNTAKDVANLHSQLEYLCGIKINNFEHIIEIIIDTLKIKLHHHIVNNVEVSVDPDDPTMFHFSMTVPSLWVHK